MLCSTIRVTCFCMICSEVLISYEYALLYLLQACFECLPSYAKMECMNERNTYSRFVNALRAPEYVPLMEGTVNNDSLVRWAYNVALTRFQ